MADANPKPRRELRLSCAGKAAIAIVLAVLILPKLVTAVTDWHVTDLLRGEIEIAKTSGPSKGQRPQFRFTVAIDGDLGYAWKVWARYSPQQPWKLLKELACDNPRLYEGQVSLEYDLKDVSLLCIVHYYPKSPWRYFFRLRINAEDQSIALADDLLIELEHSCVATAEQFLLARPAKQFVGDKSCSLWHRTNPGTSWSRISTFDLDPSGAPNNLLYDPRTDLLTVSKGGFHRQFQFDGTHTAKLATRE